MMPVEVSCRVFCTLLATCVLFQFAGAIPIDMFYLFGTQKGDATLNKGFMERSERIRVEGGFNFLGSRFYNVWVTTDGYLTLDHLTNKFASEIKPFPSKGDGAIIAPYLADADTTGVGEIYYRHITDPTDPTLKAINNDITDSNFFEFNTANFTAKIAIIATWYQVGYFHGHSDKNNTFQVAVATNGLNTVAIFNYLDNGLNWYQADEDYYDYDEVDPEISPVQVGFNKGGEDKIFYTIQDFTLTPRVLELDRYSNRNKPGQWTFNIGSEIVTIGEQKVSGTSKQNVTGDRDRVKCGSCIKKCRKDRRCFRILERFRSNCVYLLENSESVCLRSCIKAATRLKQIKRGRNVWYCMNYHNIYNRVRKFYKRKCSES